MKPLHIGLLVIGAALAGGLAVRMAEPPPLPQPSHVHAAPPTKSPAPLAIQPAIQQTEAVEPAVIAAAPPPIYSEPSHVEQPARRKPLGEIPAPSSPKPTVEFAKTISPTIAPVPYQPPPIPPTEPAIAEPPHVSAPPRQAVLEAGAALTVRLLETLSTEHALPGDIFQATLADPLLADGLIVAERGARVTGRVAGARRAGLMSGVSSLELRLLDFTTADGQRVAVSCDPWLKRGESSTRNSAERIGGGAALGTIIGAIAGGGVGAVIGAGAGGGIGAGAAALTSPRPVTIPSETVLRFHLTSRVRIIERRL